jgi:DNA-binding NarL/FixJ family response regulator
LAAFGPHALEEGRGYAARIDEALGAERASALRNEYVDVDVADAVRLCIDIVASDETTTPVAGGTRGSAAALTSREREVAALIAKGLSNKEIARQLYISRRTVDGHVERIFRKLDFTSRAQVASWVAGLGPS